MSEPRFKMLDERGDYVSAFGEVGLGNAYISGYGKLVRGKPPGELAIDESCEKEYALSGQTPTRYTLVRVA